MFYLSVRQKYTVVFISGCLPTRRADLRDGLFNISVYFPVVYGVYGSSEGRCFRGVAGFSYGRIVSIADLILSMAPVGCGAPSGSWLPIPNSNCRRFQATAGNIAKTRHNALKLMTLCSSGGETLQQAALILCNMGIRWDRSSIGCRAIGRKITQRTMR